MKTLARLVHPLRRGTAHTVQSVYRGSIGVAAWVSCRLNLRNSPNEFERVPFPGHDTAHMKYQWQYCLCCSNSRMVRNSSAGTVLHDTRGSGAERGDQSPPTRLHIPGC